jgi:hypothetical protein
MRIRCPKCSRMGFLPDHLAAEARTLRCRMCGAPFEATSLITRGLRGRAVSRAGSMATSVSRVARPGFGDDGFFDGHDEPESLSPLLGPGDSHYDFTFTPGGALVDSDGDWPEASAGNINLTDEGPSGELAAPGVADQSTPDPWPYQFIDRAGRLMFLGAAGLTISCVLVLGFFLMRIFHRDPSLSSSTLAFAVAFVLAISFVFALALTVLNLLVVDLASNVRRLREERVT